MAVKTWMNKLYWTRHGFVHYYSSQPPSPSLRPPSPSLRGTKQSRHRRRPGLLPSSQWREKYYAQKYPAWSIWKIILRIYFSWSFYPEVFGGKTSIEFFVPKLSAKKLQMNFLSRSLRRKNFKWIFCPEAFGEKTSNEFFVPKTSAEKLQLR
jgi:hypothetical protein